MLAEELVKLMSETVGVDPCMSCPVGKKLGCACRTSRSWRKRYKAIQDEYGIIVASEAMQYLREQKRKEECEEKMSEQFERLKNALERSNIEGR